MAENKIRVGITHGDTNGVGIEVILKTLMEPMIMDICIPVVFSSPKTISYHRKALGFEDFSLNPVRDLNQLNNKRPNLFNCYEEEILIELGKSSEVSGRYALRSLEAACEALKQGKIDVLVTAPINKNNIQSEQFKFAGHTEYLAEKFGQGALMILVSGTLRVGLVTGHVPVSQIAEKISSEKILSKIKTLNKSLLEDFGIRKPKIAVLGLNPHAGDNGTLGKEEQSAIIPAINAAKEAGIMAYGPYPADGFFGNSSYTKFDAILAMYHDQGLIPFKTLAFSSGVNYTAGMSVVRTSPDHGTAYDIAGKNQASEESFRNAIYLACDVFNNRVEHRRVSGNPLEITPIRKERER